MPIYEYRCDSCGNALEALQKISDAHLTDCPECGDAALRRLMSAPSFRLKGSGWYETDFKSDKERKRNLVDAGESKSSDAEKPSKSDTKEATAAKSSDSGASAGSSKDKGAAKGGDKGKSDKGSSSAVA